jgi:hypothetical protein
MTVHNFPVASGVALRLLPLTIIAVLSLSACGGSGSDPATKTAACARVATLVSQIKDVKEQEHQAFLSGGGAPAYAPYAKQWRVLDVERIAQEKVCKG